MQNTHSRTDTVGNARPKIPGVLGCYVNGRLRFQSRKHEAVRAYAQDKMQAGDNVWVAPVGSFVHDDNGSSKGRNDA